MPVESLAPFLQSLGYQKIRLPKFDAESQQIWFQAEVKNVRRTVCLQLPEHTA